MQNDRLETGLFESVLGAAIKENHMRELCLIPTEECLAKETIFSKNFESRMKIIFRKLKRKNMLNHFSLYSKRVAVTALIIISISFGAMMISPEVRAAVQQTVIEWFDKYTNFKFFDQTSEKLPDWNFSYIPEGYKKIDENTFDQGKNIMYEDKDGKILSIEFTFATDEYEVNVDNEHSNYRVIDINGYKGYLFEGTDNNGSTLIWQQGTTVFNIFSDEKDMNQIIKIAKNMTK